MPNQLKLSMQFLFFTVCLIANFGFNHATVAPCPAETAFVCDDEAPDYCDMFPIDATGGPSPKCTNATFSITAALCRQTCQRCCDDPRYACEDDSKYALTNCTEFAAAGGCQGRTTAELKLAMEKCPASCGLCNVSSCVDKDAASCREMALQCYDADYRQLMYEQCPRTCNQCGTSGSATTVAPCTDLSADCASRSRLCTNAQYVSLMKTNCAKTCNYCTSTGASGTRTGTTTKCPDKHESCVFWVPNGFCSTYDVATQKMYCPGSCNVC